MEILPPVHQQDIQAIGPGHLVAISVDGTTIIGIRCTFGNHAAVILLKNFHEKDNLQTKDNRFEVIWEPMGNALDFGKDFVIEFSPHDEQLTRRPLTDLLEMGSRLVIQKDIKYLSVKIQGYGMRFLDLTSGELDSSSTGVTAGFSFTNSAWLAKTFRIGVRSNNVVQWLYWSAFWITE